MLPLLLSVPPNSGVGPKQNISPSFLPDSMYSFSTTLVVEELKGSWSNVCFRISVGTDGSFLDLVPV